MARYDAFLLRIWRRGAEGAGGQTRWAIRLEHLPDGQGARLDSLEALLAHLNAVLPASPGGRTMWQERNREEDERSSGSGVSAH